MDRKQSDTRGSGAAGEGQAFGAYTLLREIARGHLATVYLAQRSMKTGAQRRVAVKRLLPSLGRRSEAGQLLADEARLLSCIHHPHVVSAQGAGLDDGGYVALEYVEGDSLEGLLSRRDVAPRPRLIAQIIADTLRGLTAVHAASSPDGVRLDLVHQAPRARHILVGTDGSARLADFSQARARSVLSSRARADRLRVAWMAPEQALDPDNVDLRADLFVLGVTLWEALTGEALFAAQTDEQTFQNLLHRRVLPPSEVRRDLPACFDALCLRALDRDPGQRFESAEHMLKELASAAQPLGGLASAFEVGQWVMASSGSALRVRNGVGATAAPALAPGAPPPRAASLPPLGSSAKRAQIAPRPLPMAAQASDTLVDPDQTPVFGIRRGSRPEWGPLSDEPHDEPTMPRPSLSEPSFKPRLRAGAQTMLGLDVVQPNVQPPAERDETAAVRPAQPLERAPTLPAPPLAAAGSGSEAGVNAVFGARAEPLASTAPTEILAPVPTFEESPEATVFTGQGRQPSARDNDETQPLLFVPAKAGGRRDVGAPSPGAYSQVTRGRPGEGDTGPFDDVDTSRIPMPGRPERERKAPGRSPTMPPLGMGAPSETFAKPPRARPMNIVEERPRFVQRRDSVPVARRIPKLPGAEPQKPFSPRDMPSAFVMREDGLLTAPPSGESSLVVPMDSVAPSTTGMDTAPPTQPKARRFGGPTVWLTSMALAALIVAGIGAGLARWLSASDRDRQAAAGPPSGVTPARAAAARPPLAVPTAAHAPVTAAAIPPSASVSALGAAPVVGRVIAQGGGPDGGIQGPTAQAGNPAEVRPVVPRPAPQQGAWVRPRPVAKPASPIPSNPY